MSNAPAWYESAVPTIFCGHAGAGKTNLALNLCEQIDATELTLLDLDISNPYFRSSDYSGFLNDNNVRLLGPVYGQDNTSLDTPSLMAGMSDVFSQTESVIIVDVGGDADGSKSLGRLVPEIVKSDYLLIYVANFNRLQTEKLDEHLTFMQEIEQATALTFNGIINNTHLGRETSLKDIQTSIPLAVELAERSQVALLSTAVNTEYIDTEVTVGCGLPRRLSLRADGQVLYASSDVTATNLAAEVAIWPIRTIVDFPW